MTKLESAEWQISGLGEITSLSTVGSPALTDIAALLANSDSDSEPTESDDAACESEDCDSNASDIVEEEDEDSDELATLMKMKTTRVHRSREDVAKSGMRWNATPLAYTRRRRHNVTKITPGPTVISKAAVTIKEHFFLFFPTEVLELVRNNRYTSYKMQVNT